MESDVTWCYVPKTDCPSAQAAEAWIWEPPTKTTETQMEMFDAMQKKGGA